MAFEPIFETHPLDCLRRLCSGQAVVEARLLPPSGVTVARVLSVSANPFVTISEVFTGEARYQGRVNFAVLFIDTEGKSHCMDYYADFTDKLVCDKLKSGMTVALYAHVLDTDIGEADTNIKLACVVEVNLDGVISENTQMLTNGGEGIYTHDDRIDFSRLVGLAKESITVSESVQGDGLEKIMFCEARAVINKAAGGVDMIEAEGNALCDIVCLGTNGMIKCISMSMPFSRQIPCTGARSESKVCSVAAVESARATLETDGEKCSVSCIVGICITAMVFQNETFSPIVDAFCVTHELYPTVQSVTACEIKNCCAISERIDGSVTLDINMPIADNILCIVAKRLNVTSATAGCGFVTAEGIAGCSVVYYCAEANTTSSVAVEIPFSLKVNCDADEGDIISAMGEMLSATAKIRRGNEISISAEIMLYFTVKSEKTKYVISALKKGEERALPTGAFSIHIVKSHETLWDISKALCTTPEMILLQNPGLTMPLSGGERVLCYRGKK